MSTPQVAVVGSFVVGLTLRADRFPVAGETVLARDFDLGPGGKGSNQAVQIARLGTAVEFVGVIGDDDFGAIGAALHESEGVGTKHLERSRRNTGVGFIILNASGDNRILLDPGSNDEFAPAHVQTAADTLAASQVVLAQLEIPAETALEGLRLGKASDCTTILNPAPARPVPEEMFAHIDILTPNQTEARVILGLPPDDPTGDVELCKRLLDLGVETVVLTRGEEGAEIVQSGRTEHVDAFPVQVTDSTGAGDAFNGALAAALAGGSSLPEAVRRGAAAGALACTKLGVIPALSTFDELERLLAGS